MKNSEKAELRMDVRDLDGYEKKDAIQILVKDYGYCRTTASRYWDVFSKKPSHKTRTTKESEYWDKLCKSSVKKPSSSTDSDSRGKK